MRLMAPGEKESVYSQYEYEGVSAVAPLLPARPTRGTSLPPVGGGKPTQQSGPGGRLAGCLSCPHLLPYYQHDWTTDHILDEVNICESKLWLQPSQSSCSAKTSVPVNNLSGEELHNRQNCSDS